MILAGIQPSAVWFRVLQGMAAPACDRLCGGCLTLSLCPTAGWCVGPASRHRHRVWGKDAEARGLFGKAQKGSVLPLCLPCAEMAAHWGSLAMGRTIAKLPNGIAGLAVSCCGPFWGDLQLQPHSQTPVPSRAVLGAGSSWERGLCWAGEAQISQVKWSSSNTCD